MKAWLQRPYPALEGVGAKLAMSLGIGIVCFLILNIFRPFGLHVVTNISFIAGFGGIATISLLTHFFLIPWLIPSLYDVDRWTIKHQLLFTTSIVLLISVLNYFYNSTIGLYLSTQYNIIEFIYLTISVGVLPTIIMTYSTEIIARNRNINRAIALNEMVHNTVPTKKIIIRTESRKDTLIVLQLDDFIYATASNNYCEIHYLENNVVRKKLIRIKLKGLEDQMNQYPNILRCHKSYLVNKEKIKSFEGNARSMTLKLGDINKLIPVSRSLDRSLLQ